MHSKEFEKTREKPGRACRFKTIAFLLAVLITALGLMPMFSFVDAYGKSVTIAVPENHKITNDPVHKENAGTPSNLNNSDNETVDRLVWPVPNHATLTQGFHDNNAIDISDGSIAGASVVAAKSGKITSLFKCAQNHYGSFGDCYGFGTGLVILGDDGKAYQYAHLRANSIPSNLAVGSKVTAGTVIGQVGNTGNSAGTHLHFGISNTSNYWDKGTNPTKYQYTNLPLTVRVEKNNSVYSISEKNAIVGASFYFKGTNDGALNDIKYYLLDEFDNQLAYKYESWNEGVGLTYGRWFDNVASLCDAKADLNYTLLSGTKYTIKIVANVMGDDYVYSETFTTKGNKEVLTAPITFHNQNYGDFKYTVGKTNAFLVQMIRPNEGYALNKLSKVGIEFMDKDEKVIASKEEQADTSDSAGSFVFYDVNDELKITLSEGTEYKYRFFGIYSGQKFYSSQYSFTTEKTEISLSSIEIDALPSKTVYELGEQFESDGLTLLLKYSDGSTQKVESGFTVNGYSSASAGTKTVTVTYSGKTTTFDVTVKPATPIPSNSMTISASNVKTTAGREARVTLELKNNSGIVSLVVSVGYDKSVMTLTGVEDGGIICNPNNAPTLTANPYKLAWEDDTAEENYSGNGQLTTLVFKIADDAPEGEYVVSLSFKDGDAYDVAMNDVFVSVINGSVTVANVLIGDVNGDGTVNGKDRTILSRYLAGWDGYAAQVVLAACDINGDGTVNGKDRTILSRHLAGWGGVYDSYFE